MEGEKEPTLVEFYKQLLTYAGLFVDNKGTLRASLAYMGKEDSEDDERNDIIVSGKKVLLPTEENLRTANKQGNYIFHPLHEKLNTRESETVSLLRRSLITRINYTTMLLGRSLLEIAGNPEMQRGVSKSLREMLAKIKDADPLAHVRWLDIIGKLLARFDINALVNLYVKRHGRFHGTTRKMVGIVSFPYLKNFDKFDGKCKKNDRELFTSVLDAVFPDSREPEAYGWYSEHSEIPRLDALIQGSKTVVLRINEVIRALEPYLPEPELLYFDTDFTEYLDDLNYLRKQIRLIPPQKGNHGQVGEDEDEEKIEQEKDSNMDKQTSSNYLPVPPKRTQPQTNMQYNQLPPQPQYTQMPQQQAHQAMPPYPQQNTMMPVPPPQPQPQPYQENTLSTTEAGKLDFKSVERANPMVAAAGMVQTPLNTWGQVQQGVPMVDPRTGATYFMPPQQAVPAAPAYPGMVPQVPLDAWGRPMAQAPVQAMGYPQPAVQPMGFQPAGMAPVVPGTYGQQTMLDAWGRPVGRPPAQPAYPAVHVGSPLGRV